MKNFGYFLTCTCILFSALYATEDVPEKESKNEPPEIGNFSLPGSRIPGALVSFGGNILDKGQAQIFLYSSVILGKDSFLSNFYPNILYGITDDFSIYLNTPFSLGNKVDHFHSSGPEDMYIQFEYAFFTKNSKYAIDAATVVGAIIFPTGSFTSIPTTGMGSMSYFLGATFSRTTVNWSFFTGHGMTFTTSKFGIRPGEQFLYQFGIENYIPSPPGWKFAWVVELDGFYFWKSHLLLGRDSQTGGNIIYVTPSIWISKKKQILQLGVGFPVTQHLFGHQPRQSLLLALNVGIVL